MDFKGNLNIGIFFNSRPDQGGLYQYSLKLIDCLLNFAPDWHRYFLFQATHLPFPLVVNQPNWVLYNFSNFQLYVREAIEIILLAAARKNININPPLIPIYQEVKRSQLKLMVYTKPTIYSFQWQIPYIFPVHDLQHRIQPEFREVSANGEANRREYLYTRSIAGARGIITDSEVGKEDVLNFYNANPDHVFPLPYIPAIHGNSSISAMDLDHARNKYHLPTHYLFYPASFWPHKNHSRLIESIAYLRDTCNFQISLVLAGKFKHDYEKLLSLTSQLNLDDQIKFIGYVPDEDLSAIYRMATALVMPTYFGPTNIPVLEAWSFSCPVITSDIRGIREQVGDAGILVNPSSSKSIAEGIHRLVTEDGLRDQLIEAGIRKTKVWGPRDFADSLVNIIQVSSATNKSIGS